MFSRVIPRFAIMQRMKRVAPLLSSYTGPRSFSSKNSSEAETERRELNRLVIEQECGEYIMDKAADLSLSVRSVKVGARWSREGVWVPDRVSIILAEDGSARTRLVSLIEAELGIPEEVQEWSIEGYP